MLCVDNPLTIGPSEESDVLRVSDKSLASIDWKSKGGRGVKRGVTGRCVSAEGGSNCLSNTPQDTSHTSLGGGGKKESGRQVYCEKQQLTHINTHTSAPITPILSLELTG